MFTRLFSALPHGRGAGLRWRLLARTLAFYFPHKARGYYRPNQIVGGNRFFRDERIFRQAQIPGIDIQPFGRPLP